MTDQDSGSILVTGCAGYIDCRISQSTKNATLLVKVAAEVALGKREQLYVHGTDFLTSDGTGIHDYIHVSDLALDWRPQFDDIDFIVKTSLDWEEHLMSGGKPGVAVK